MTLYRDQNLSEYLNELSSEKSVPGGGSVSAYVASLAAGLSQMVIRVTLKRKPKAEWSEEQIKADQAKRESLSSICESLEKIKTEAFDVVDEDPKVYDEVMNSYKDAEKMESALWKSFQLQADLAQNIVLAAELNGNLQDMIKGSIKNDLVVSEGLLQGAFTGAHSTANINVVYMKDESSRTQAEERLEALKARMQKGVSACQ
jgi:formiminotetrahydrofolate cyclodeaminase